MIVRQRFFRILGAICIVSGFYAFYDYSLQLPSLFEHYISGIGDPFHAYVILTSFSLGAIGLVWTGIRLITMRSFEVAWVYVALLPIIAWLLKLYSAQSIFPLDTVLLQEGAYACIFLILIIITRYVHVHWFTPLSHEGDRHIGLEKSRTPLIVELRWALLVVIFVVFVIFNPHDALSAFNATISWIHSAWIWLGG